LRKGCTAGNFTPTGNFWKAGKKTLNWPDRPD
jgi:hypothetical protein